MTPRSVVPSWATLAASLLLLLPMSAGAQSTTASSRAAPATVTIPDSPSGERLRGWLAAFNTGSRDTLRQFVQQHQTPPPNDTLPVDRIVDRQLGLYRKTQGLALRRIDASTADRITAIVQARVSGAWMAVGMTVSPDTAHRVVGMGFRNTLAPPELLPARPFTERAIRDSISAEPRHRIHGCGERPAPE
jgi:hypothetical protein